MALDAQSNWNIETYKPRVAASHSVLSDQEKLEKHFDELKIVNRIEVYLPHEILLQIFAYIPGDAQSTYHACSLVCRSWYAACVAFLYQSPILDGHNFSQFVATVCPSKNAHIRHSEVAGFVKVLDMGQLVHDSSKSLTARIIGRLKGSLIEFRAPQASFSVNSLAALSKAVNLVRLDLSLMSAGVQHSTLFHTLDSLVNLEVLFFPRSAIPDMGKHETNHAYSWPPRLKTLHLAGGIDDYFLRKHVGNISKSLERLSIQHCPMIYPGALRETLTKIGGSLQHLTLRYPLNRLHRGALNQTLSWCPNLVALRISADYIDANFFEPESIVNFETLEDGDIVGHPLRILELECSHSAGEEVGIDPDVVWTAIDAGLLPWLRSVRVSARLAWNATSALKENTVDLSDIMIALEREKPTGVVPGVWIVP